jgi:hypothetical protein
MQLALSINPASHDQKVFENFNTAHRLLHLLMEKFEAAFAQPCGADRLIDDAMDLYLQAARLMSSVSEEDEARVRESGRRATAELRAMAGDDA